MTPKGIRLNNPLNLKHGSDWQGLTPVQSDPEFCEFTDVKWCYRAGAKILDAYAKRGITSIPQIIATYAPPSENDTAAYIAAVSARVKDPSDTLQMLKALTWHEIGQMPYTDEQINEGIALARGESIVTKAEDAAKPGWQPTGSTYGSGAGTLLGTTVVGLFATYGHPLDPTTAAAMTGFLAIAVGYFFPGGRK